MINANDAYMAVCSNGHISPDLMNYLLKLINKDRASRQLVQEGDIVKIKDKIFVVAKIFDFTDYYQVDQDNLELLAVLYDPIKKTLGFAWEGLYTEPSMCEIAGHIDPKQIFREDIKL